MQRVAMLLNFFMPQPADWRPVKQTTLYQPQLGETTTAKYLSNVLNHGVNMTTRSLFNIHRTFTSNCYRTQSTALLLGSWNTKINRAVSLATDP